MPIKTPEQFKEDWSRWISFEVWREKGFWKWLKDGTNLIDDYPDAIKEWLH
jgi:hypothetical protein